MPSTFHPVSTRLAGAALLLAGVIGALPVHAESAYPGIYAGGVTGFRAMAKPENSEHYRKDGGGLYLHSNGWVPLGAVEKADIQKMYAGNSVAVEIGYGPQSLSDYLKNYFNRGIRPKFISVNVFHGKDVLEPAPWADFIASFRNAGIDSGTLILPTFEFANLTKLPLSSNMLSQRTDFQEAVRTAGGLTIDTPSSYFFARPEDYRRWVIDAIRWAHSQGLAAVVIVSPRDAGLAYAEKTRQYLDYLVAHDAMPNMLVIENYHPATPGVDPDSAEQLAHYPNVVGSETMPNQQLGVARAMQSQWLPKVLNRGTDIDGDGVKAAQETDAGTSNLDPHAFRFAFDKAGDLKGWVPNHNIANLRVANGSLKGTTTSIDPSIVHPNLHLNGSTIDTVQVYMRSSEAGQVQAYFATEGGGVEPGNVVTATYLQANVWQLVSLPMAHNPKWRNRTISTLRIDPISAAHASFEIGAISGSGR